jgi:arylsulfatase A-like enzyme
VRTTGDAALAIIMKKRSKRPSTLRNVSRREFLALGAACTLPAALSRCNPTGPAAVSAGSGASPERPNVIVFLADTLRADGLGGYGNSYNTSPNIDAWAENAMVFDQCYSQSSWTKPSVASLFTGMLPRVHQAAVSEWHLPDIDKVPVQLVRDQFVTLAEAFQAMGYITGMFAANPHVQQEFGFAQGFDKYQYMNTQGAAGQISDVMEWLISIENENKPFFAFIHEIDPHGPYTPTPGRCQALFGRTCDELRAELNNDDRTILENYTLFYEKQFAGEAGERPPLDQLSERGVKSLRMLYDAEVSYVDEQFHRLVRWLDRTGRGAKTMMTLFGDHGEGFGEHFTFLHGNSLFDEEVHVPLIVRHPLMEKQIRVPSTVSLMDLYPTLVTLVGGTPPANLQAESLATDQGSVAIESDRPVFADLEHGTADIGKWSTTMVQGQYKVMVDAKQPERIKVYDRVRDPGEVGELLGKPEDPGEHVHQLVAKYQQTLEKHRKLSTSLGDAEWTEGSEQMREEINAIGYI